MSQIRAWSIWSLVYGILSLGHGCILVCLNVLISIHLGHLLMYSSTSLQYLTHQACNLNLLCVTATLPWTSSCTLLITSFLKILGGTIASVLNITSLSTINLCCASLKGLSTIVQLLHTFFLMRTSILMSIRSHWVSLLSVLQDSTSVSTHCIILSSEFSCSSPFSLWNLSQDSVSISGMVFPLAYIMSKSNAMILITHLKILDDVTLGNSCSGREISYFSLACKFNSTLNFTQSGWPILFIPDLHFWPANWVSCQCHTGRSSTAIATLFS